MTSSPPETITVDTETLACDGGGGPLGLPSPERSPGFAQAGHPRVYLHMAKSNSVNCPYCGRHYVLASGAKTGTGH